MTDQPPRDASPPFPNPSSEPQADPPTLPPTEPTPAPEHPEEQTHQTEVKPEPTAQNPDTIMGEAAVRPSTPSSIFQLSLTDVQINLQPSPTPHSKPPSTMPRHSTPSQPVNGAAETFTIPSKAASHGAPARRYLNEKVTGVLLEGMKKLVVQQ